jgi:hypothetical protein
MFYKISHLSHALHTPCPFYRPLFARPNNISWRAQITNAFIHIFFTPLYDDKSIADYPTSFLSPSVTAPPDHHTHTQCLSISLCVDYRTRTVQLCHSPIFHARRVKTFRSKRGDVRGNKRNHFPQHSQFDTAYEERQSSAFFVSHRISGPTECLASASTLIQHPPPPPTNPLGGYSCQNDGTLCHAPSGRSSLTALLRRFQHHLSSLGGRLHVFVAMTRLQAFNTSWRNCIYCYARYLIWINDKVWD